jgi:hypothetical protein
LPSLVDGTGIESVFFEGCALVMRAAAALYNEPVCPQVFDRTRRSTSD